MRIRNVARRQRARPLVVGCNTSRDHFGGFHVRLIERIHTKHSAGDGRRKLPAIELRAERLPIGPVDSDNRVAGTFEPFDRGVLRRVCRARQAKLDEHAIAPVYVRTPQYFAVDRENALPLLAERFGDELLEPRAKCGEAGGSDQSGLVAAMKGELSKHDSELECRVVRPIGSAATGHRLGAIEERSHIGPDQRSRNEPEIRQGRVTASDAGHTVKDRAEMFLFGDHVQLRSRIGRQHESLSGFLAPQLLSGAIEKVLLQDVHLEGAARFRRHEKQRAPEIDGPLDGENSAGIGGIEDVEIGIATLGADERLNDLRRQARATHAEQHDVLHAFCFDLGGEAGEPRDVRPFLRRQGQPAKPSIFVGTSPDRRIAGPDASHDILATKIRHAPANVLGEIRRKTQGEIGCRHLCAHFNGPAHPARSLQRQHETKAQQDRDDEGVDGRMQGIGFHLPPIVRDPGNAGEIDQSVDPLPVAAAKTPDPALCRREREGNHRDECNEPDRDIRTLGDVFPHRQEQIPQRAHGDESIWKIEAREAIADDVGQEVQ